MAKKTKKKAAKKPAKKTAKKAAKKAAKKPAKKPAKKAAKKAAPAEPAQPPKPRHGEFMWNELMTRDDEKALGFFENLLGWTHQDWPMGPDAVYRLAKVGDKSVAGMMKMTSPQFPDFVPPHWMSYIAVDNVDQRWERALSLGGEAIHPPTDIPEVGRFCIIKDPSGAAIALMTPLGGTA
jgi:predicted enzyme related to lactoylglutathione lyase